MTQDQTIAFLRAIGCEAQAGDTASLRFAERVIEAERARIAGWLRGQPDLINAELIAHHIERGDHEREGPPPEGSGPGSTAM